MCSGLLITKYMYSKKIGGGYIKKKYVSVIKIVIPAIILPAILMRLGMLYHLDALAINSNLVFVKGYNTVEPTALNILKDVVMSLFTGSNFNGPLWTMKHQLLGSILVSIVSYFVINFVSNKNERKYVYILVLIPFAYINYHLCGFIFGAFVYECFYSIESDDSMIGRIIKMITFSKCGKACMLIVGGYFACINCAPLTGIYEFLLPIQMGNTIIRAGGVAMLLFVVLNSIRLQKLFDRKILRFIGKYSAYIYAFHWPILLSLGCYIYVSGYKYINYNVLCIVILISCIILTVVLSTLYSRGEKVIEARIKFKANSKEKLT